MCYETAVMRLLTCSSLALVILGVAACQQPAPAPAQEAPTKDAPATATPAADAKTAPGTAVTKTAADGEEVMDGCPGEEDSAGAEEEHAGCGEIEAATAKEGHFGKPFALDKRESLTAATTRLASVEAGETVQVTGTVDSVCKKKGCWMVIKDGDNSARIFTHAGKFFMPVDTNKGRKVVVEGELKPKTMSERFAKHLAEDKGDDPSTVKGPTKEWVLNATSAELL